MPLDRSKVLVIVGPTGSGKTDFAIRIAKRFNGELIAADSRTVYRGMDIGTAKSVYPHHLLDIRNPNESYSVAEFKADAERLIHEITERGHLPIVVGGTGLYIAALVDNLTLPALPAQPKLRESFERKSLPELLTLLRSLDPVAVRMIDQKNKRRIIRALEVCVFTGHPFSALRTRGEPQFDILEIGIQRTRTALYRRIDRRIREMFRQGLVDEVRRLLDRYGPTIEPLCGIIYREVVEHLQDRNDGREAKNIQRLPPCHSEERSDEESQETQRSGSFAAAQDDTVFGIRHRRHLRELTRRIMYANHRYARHQLMWFKRDKHIHWVRTAQQAERLVREFL